MTMTRWWVIIFWWLTFTASSQPIREADLLQRLFELQKLQRPSLLPGIVPSYVTRKPRLSEAKLNNNIFYNDLLIFTLQNLGPSLSNHKAIVDSIIKYARIPFDKFVNKKGRGTYNFWRTDSAYTFPYNWWVSVFRNDYAPPDDLDVTALSMLALASDSSSIASIHSIMQGYVHNGKKSRSVGKRYQSFQFYSSWFGKKFPVVLDVCVLTNILCMVEAKKLKWTKADSASLDVIVTAIQNQDIVRQPLAVSPYYGKASLLLYHIARLMHVRTIPKLEAQKQTLCALAVDEFRHSKDLLEKIILSIALLKWGYEIPQLVIPEQPELNARIERSNFPFFIGNVSSYLSNGKRVVLTNLKVGLFYHYCPAWNDVLLLEYLVLMNQRADGNLTQIKN
jgi:hypothetical protein